MVYTIQSVPFSRPSDNLSVITSIFLTPPQVKPENDDWENWFSDQDKELQQIFQGQSEMKNVISDLHRKMDEIIGRQERTLSMISGIQVS